MAGDKFKKKSMYWFVRRKKDNLLIGTAALNDINFERKSAEIGYGISPDLWGNVYALQIIETLKHYCFEVLALNRIFGKTFIDNKKVINLTKSLSFKKEGVAKEFYFKNYKYIDAYLYSLIKKDYLEIDKAINNKKNIKKIQIWSSVPTLIMLMDKMDLLKPNIFPEIKKSLFCGEPLTKSIADKWQIAAPNSTIENLYGPTEATIWLTRYIYPKNKQKY